MDFDVSPPVQVLPETLTRWNESIIAEGEEETKKKIDETETVTTATTTTTTETTTTTTTTTAVETTEKNDVDDTDADGDKGSPKDTNAEDDTVKEEEDGADPKEEDGAKKEDAEDGKEKEADPLAASSKKEEADSLFSQLDAALEETEKAKNTEKNKEPKKKRDGFWDKSPFPYDEEINQKIVLWKGDLCSLAVDAVVNTTNERLNDYSGISGRIFHFAGTELQTECIQSEGCPTGDAIITKAYKLFAKNIIHTVGPRYSVKYQTAAENALHGCYRKSLEVLKDEKLSTIAFCVVNTERKGYPPKPASHVAFRTVRRFLERHGSTIKTIVFCVITKADWALYNEVLPLYFPRSEDEENRVVSLLPKEIGNELGEKEIEDRKIRLATPGIGGFLMPVRPTVETKSKGTMGGGGLSDGFHQMQEHPDEIRRREDALKPHVEKQREEENRRYNQYVQRSKEEDLSDLEALNFIYQSGNDTFGRPIIVVVASALPMADPNNHERVVLYMIRLLDPIVDADYNLIYFHTNFSSANKPPTSWLKVVYNVFNRKYKKNMKRLFIVHPTMWVRLAVWFVKPFVKKKFWKKVQYIHKLRDIYDSFEPKTLRIPESILKYDQDQFGDTYAFDVGRSGTKSNEDDAKL